MKTNKLNKIPEVHIEHDYNIINNLVVRLFLLTSFV